MVVCGRPYSRDCYYGVEYKVCKAAAATQLRGMQQTFAQMGDLPVSSAVIRMWRRQGKLDCGEMNLFYAKRGVVTKAQH